MTSRLAKLPYRRVKAFKALVQLAKRPCIESILRPVLPKLVVQRADGAAEFPRQSLDDLDQLLKRLRECRDTLLKNQDAVSEVRPVLHPAESFRRRQRGERAAPERGQA